MPRDARAAACMAQVIAFAAAIALAFRPLVLQVFAHRVFRPLEGLVLTGAFAAAAEGGPLGANHPAPGRWWGRVRELPGFIRSGRPLPRPLTPDSQPKVNACPVFRA